MLKKANQLRLDEDFSHVFKGKLCSYGKILGIKAVLNGLDISRFGILVSNRVSKKAVARNQIKRQIREIIRLRFHKIKPGYDAVIIALPLISEKDYQDIESEIDYILKKLCLY